LWPTAAAEPSEVDLESLLSDAFSPDTPLIGLGEPGEAIGAGRVKSSETEWREDVEAFASAAEIILVIPSAHEGTKWEINYLKERGLLAKCIFVMPPFTNRELSEEWTASIDKMPICMPQYHKRGMVFSVDSLGQIVESAHLTVKTTRALVSRIASVSQVPTRNILSYKLTDQPIFRVLGFVGIYPVIVILLGILFLVLMLLFSLMR